MPKVIVLSQVALPSSKIGSWPTLYANYLKRNNNVDYIICPFTEDKFQNIDYRWVKSSFAEKIKNKIYNRRFGAYCNMLTTIIEPHEKYIIQVIDNFKIVNEIKEELDKNNLTSQCNIQFFYHGFAPFLSNEKSIAFFESIQEMVVLTNASYKEHLKYYNALPCKFSVLHNGIDTKIFYKITDFEKKDLKSKYKCLDKEIFIWCSQDRPKKGLDFILNVWKKIYNKNKNVELFVIGANRDFKMEGVRFLGKIPNSEIASYYQMADVYLFPSLWQEGFGLTLIEALHSGCYCIASKIGGIAEVLQNGKLGRLIENPHFVLEWEIAINEYLDGNFELPQLADNLYSMESWNEGMNRIINDAKYRFNS